VLYDIIYFEFIFLLLRGGKMFKLVSDYKPTGDQPQAIDKLSKGILEGKKFQTLLGVTGSRKDIYNGKHYSASSKAYFSFGS
jgi:hypothetical protein